MQYISEQYKKLGICLDDFETADWFNPNIYDREVPRCTSCNMDFANFKSGHIEDDMEVEWSHPTSCLWFDYFSDKVKQSCKRPKFVRKVKRAKH